MFLFCTHTEAWEQHRKFDTVPNYGVFWKNTPSWKAGLRPDASNERKGRISRVWGLDACGALALFWLSVTAPDPGRDNMWVSQVSVSLSAGLDVHAGLLPENEALQCFVDAAHRQHPPKNRSVVVPKRFVNHSQNKLARDWLNPPVRSFPFLFFSLPSCWPIIRFEPADINKYQMGL